MSLSGNLKTVSFPDILQLLATGKKSGVLEVRTTARQKEIAFREGNIISAISVNSSEDLLGNMLLRRGRISKSDLERAITLHKQTGRQLGATLIDMNLFDKAEISECLKLQIEETVYNLFSWREGEFLFHEGAAPKSTPFAIELNTMNVIMEGTRRIDEWMEIQKVLPPDDAVLALAANPNSSQGEIRLTLDEFRVLALINGERTLPELANLSPMGEFVTYRAVYKLVQGRLIEISGRKEGEQPQKVDEEEIVISTVFRLYNACLYRIRAHVEAKLGEDNRRFSTFVAQYRGGLASYFPGVDPASDLMPSYDRFLKSVRAIPEPQRMHQLLKTVDAMLSEQLEFVFQLLGAGVFRQTLADVKREITEPLARQREVVKRYSLEEDFYQTLRKADRVAKMVRG